MIPYVHSETWVHDDFKSCQVDYQSIPGIDLIYRKLHLLLLSPLCVVLFPIWKMLGSGMVKTVVPRVPIWLLLFLTGKEECFWCTTLPSSFSTAALLHHDHQPIKQGMGFLWDSRWPTDNLESWRSLRRWCEFREKGWFLSLFLCLEFIEEC